MKKALFVATVDVHIRSFHLPYLKLLHNNGYEVHVATNGDEQFPNCDVKHQICIERNPFKLNNLKAIKQLKKIIDDEKFDLIHCHTPMGSVVARLAAKKSRKKYGTRVIYTAHGFHFYKGAPLLNWLLFYPIEKFLARYTDTLITINTEDYELAKRKFKKCKDIQRVPGVGIYIDKFNIKMSDEEKNDFKKSLGLKKDDYVLSCIARLDKNKNQGFLINAMEKLVKEHNNIHLLLAGPDELNGYYQEMTKDKGLDSNIHFLGRRDDVPKILSITDIVVSASLREGLPVNVIEAFAAGKPVVALNCRGMKDLIVNGENGYLVNFGDIDKFIDCIEKFYSKSIVNEFDCKIETLVLPYSLDSILNDLKKIYFKRKKIIHLLASDKFSGAENVVCSIISCLKEDYDIYYCSPSGPIKDILKRRNINYIPLSGLSRKNIKKVISEYHPDIIHAHDFRCSFYASLFSKNIRIISHIHKNDPAMNKLSIKSILFFFISFKFFRIIGVSDSINEEFYFKKSINTKYVTINNYVDAQSVIKKSESAIDYCGIDCCFLGRLSEEKNPIFFIKIVNELSKQNKNIKAIIIGDGPYKNCCHDLIESLNLTQNIKMLGFCDNPYPYLKHSKCCIMPSKFEGFGLAAVESLIVGTPVLNSGVGGLKYIFKDNLEQFICKDLNDYIDKYNCLLNNHELYDFSHDVEQFTDFNKWRRCLDELYK